MATYAIVLEMKKLLHNLDGWLDKAVSTATAKKFDPNVLLQSRLAPDMFPLIRQVQTACDNAKFAAARAAGKEAPKHPDEEKTIEEVRARIATTISYLETFTKSDFEAIGTRTVALPFWEGKSMHAFDYVIEFALPNFFFHLTTAYAILRHNGIEVGKRDYIGSLNFRG